MQPTLHVPHDVGKRKALPVRSEAQMPARERALDHDVVRQAPRLRGLPHEEIECPAARNHHPETRIAKPRMPAHERKGSRMQARRKADPVDARIKRPEKAGPQGFERGVHRELLHDVDVNSPLARPALHHAPEIELRGLADLLHGKVKPGLARRALERLAGKRLHAREARPEKTVRKVRHHRVRDVPDATARGHGLRHFGGRNVHAHPSLHDRNQTSPLELKAKVVKSKVFEAFHL